MAKLIIDVSHHQDPNKFDWEKAKDQVALFIIRVQYGSTTIDKQYKNFVAKCKQYGIPYIFYAYGLYVSVNDAKVEAKDFIDRIKQVDPNPGAVVLDTEGDTLSNCGAANLAAASQAFIDYCRAAGIRTGFYVAHHMYKGYGLDKVSADFLWIPRYGTNDGTPNTNPDYPCDLWQYTEKGRVDFYPGFLDLNKLNGSKSLEYIMGKDAASIPSTPAHELTKPAPAAPAKKISGDTYTVQPGDTLSEIAAAADLSLDTLIQINGIQDKNMIRVGQVIRLKAAAPDQPAPAAKTYTVRSGDTLSEIADDHGMSTAALAALNGIHDVNKIYAGQVLKVSGSAAKPQAPAAQYHTVKSGDSLSRIAANNGISLEKIKSLNPGVKGPKYIIQPGQKIRVK